MLGKPVFVKRKKFTEEATSETRLKDRWDQQVFFLMQKFPQAEAAISDIRDSHAAKLGNGFVPTEESLAELADLRHTLA